MPSPNDYLATHYIHKSNWLRAAVLGANDGILSVSAIAIGVASANPERSAIVLSALAGLVAGALSMAAGEYVSVSSQTDIEKADIEREKAELLAMPAEELDRLTEIYEARGLSRETARRVAEELTDKDALAAHVRDELGITEMSQANPLQAALASGLAFTVGSLLPLAVTFFAPIGTMVYILYAASLLFLAILGAISARTGGAPMGKAILRVVIWGTLAMAISAGVGHLFGVSV